MADPPRKKRTGWMPAGLAARLVVGGLFILAAIGKIQDPSKFVSEIRQYQLIPIAATNSLGYMLPWLELLSGVLLVIGLWRVEARLVIAAMLVVFTAAKAYTFAKGMQIECGCGGSFTFLTPIFNNPQGIATNVVLLGLLAVDWQAQRLKPRPARISVDTDG